MQIHNNEKLYKRNILASFLSSLLGMFALVGSVYVLFGQGQFGLYLFFLVLGIALVQIGTWLSRWGRRADQGFNKALQSLDHQHTLYHYRSPVAHLLVAPSGVWLLLPRQTRGTVSFDKQKNRWTVKVPNVWARLGQEGIGRPVAEASLEAEAIDRFLQNHWPEAELRLQAVLVMMDENTAVESVAGAPIPTSSIRKLKQVVQNGDPQAKLSAAQRETLTALLAKHYPG